MGVALLVLLLAQSFPEGPGKNTFEQICNFCHPATFVSDKAKTRVEWGELVAEMLKEEKISQPEQDQIVGYLARAFPKRVNVNQAVAQEIQDVLEIPESAAAAIVASRRANGALKSMDDLAKIPGIDSAKMEEVRNRVVF